MSDVEGTGDRPSALDPGEAGTSADPYPRYRAMREEMPRQRTDMGHWSLFRYADVARVLRDPRFGVDERRAATPRTRFADRDPQRAPRGRSAILNVDPPDHTRLRRVVAPAFTPRAVDRLRSRIARLVDEALDRVTPRGEMDVIADLAFPLPFTVISELLGMPGGEREELRRWAHVLAGTLEPVTDPAGLDAQREASDAMTAFVRDALAWKRRHPADDLLTALLAGADRGELRSEQELLDQVILLYVAGHETTVNLIGNGMLALLRHPAQLERLVGDDGLDADAVEELLRYDAPVQFSRRVALEDVDLDELTIEAGSLVLVCLGSANRDPDRFGPTADDLDLGRRDAGLHLSFGGGVHHCLGSSLARIEARAAIGALVRRFPAIEATTDDPPWNGRVVLRGLDRLPVRLGP
ncbi:MAG: cytochrome P450 [Acidimicrobiia bacterium]|nr:cytochrome P450 [Acidimicrobiia bacterium]